MTFEPSLDISVRFASSPDEVWNALTDRRALAKWWPALSIDVGKPPGGEFTAELRGGAPAAPRQRIRGKITRVDEGQEIRIFAHSDPGNFDSKIRLSLAPHKKKTRLRVVESVAPKNGDTAQIVSECREGWRAALDDLRHYLED